MPPVNTTNTTAGTCTGTAFFNDSLYPYTVDGWYMDTSFLGNNGNYISGLCAGNYSVAVHDSNGTQSFSFTIGTDSSADPCANFYVYVTGTNTTAPGVCDGSAMAYANGGTSPYMYMWSDSSMSDMLSGLCVGSYSVTVSDANGCSSNASYYVNQDSTSGPCSNFYAYVSGTNTSSPNTCDGSAMASVSGGSGVYTYLWSDSSTASTASNLCAGTYTVTVTDADTSGCSASATYTVNSGTVTNNNLYIDVYTYDSDSCMGEAYISVYNAVGGGALYVTDENGVTFFADTSTSTTAYNLCAGVYTVAAYDYGTGDTAYYSFVIGNSTTIYNNNPYPDSSSVGTVSSPGQLVCNITYNAIDSVMISNYVFSSPDSIYVTWDVYSGGGSSQVYDYYMVSGGGVYTLILQIYCDSSRAVDFIKAYDNLYIDPLTVGINKVDAAKTAIFPVPAGNTISVALATETASVSVLNAFGQEVVKSVKLSGAGVHTLSLEGLSSGYYIAKIDSGSKAEYIKFAKQ